MKTSQALGAALAGVAVLVSVPLAAQPADLPIAPASGEPLPPGVRVARSADGAVYVDARGRTLYGLDLRTVHRSTPNPIKYCPEHCEAQWEPLLAPAGTTPNIELPDGTRRLRRLVGGEEAPRGAAPASPPARGGGGEEDETRATPDGQPFYTDPQKAPDWTVIQGPAGAQWLYKGWHMVYRRADEKPGQATQEGANEFTWNTLKFVPPVPDPDVPAGIAPVFSGGSYALADAQGRLLFTGSCGEDCGGWTPLRGGMANRGLGAWKIDLGGAIPQWTYSGKPVFVAEGDLPSGAEILRP